VQAALPRSRTRSPLGFETRPFVLLSGSRSHTGARPLFFLGSSLPLLDYRLECRTALDRMFSGRCSLFPVRAIFCEFALRRRLRFAKVIELIVPIDFLFFPLSRVFLCFPPERRSQFSGSCAPPGAPRSVLFGHGTSLGALGLSLRSGSFASFFFPSAFSGSLLFASEPEIGSPFGRQSFLLAVSLPFLPCHHTTTCCCSRTLPDHVHLFFFSGTFRTAGVALPSASVF